MDYNEIYDEIMTFNGTLDKYYQGDLSVQDNDKGNKENYNKLFNLLKDFDYELVKDENSDIRYDCMKQIRDFLENNKDLDDSKKIERLKEKIEEVKKNSRVNKEDDLLDDEITLVDVPKKEKKTKEKKETLFSRIRNRFNKKENVTNNTNNNSNDNSYYERLSAYAAESTNKNLDKYDYEAQMLGTAKKFTTKPLVIDAEKNLELYNKKIEEINRRKMERLEREGKLNNQTVNNENVIKDQEEKINDEINNTKIEENVNEDIKNNVEEAKEENVNEIKKYSFDSIEAVKSKFDEFDKRDNEYKEISDKVKYYEDFLNNHDLSHNEDKEMFDSMKSKLEEYKSKYDEISDKNKIIKENDEKMAYYTQIAKAIDKEIEKIELNRKDKIRELEKQGKTVINLGLSEERKIDEEKTNLINLKNECLKRKDDVLKGYTKDNEKAFNIIANNNSEIIKENNLNNSINNENLNDKSVSEIRQLASEEKIKNIKKKKKEILVNELNHLNEIKKDYIDSEEDNHTMNMGFIDIFSITILTITLGSVALYIINLLN